MQYTDGLSSRAVPLGEKPGVLEGDVLSGRAGNRIVMLGNGNGLFADLQQPTE